jgi:hypothetical protein
MKPKHPFQRRAVAPRVTSVPLPEVLPEAEVTEPEVSKELEEKIESSTVPVVESETGQDNSTEEVEADDEA